MEKYYSLIGEDSRRFIDESVERIIAAKKKGGKVVVATGSGPNIHEGVTTLISELMYKGIIDGVTTSSAVIAHELGGVLDKVKRMAGRKLNSVDIREYLPRGDVFELTELDDEYWHFLESEMILDHELIEDCRKAEGKVIIKAAGNMAYPMGLFCERISGEILDISRTYGIPFEKAAGWGSDRRTMIGAGARLGLPVLVSVPQLIGGGAVGMAIGDSVPVSRRCALVAEMLESADVIIESAVALTQEIHDGPFETFTGHGIWAMWNGYHTYSLKGKTIIRIDLDDNLKKAWELDKNQGSVQTAIDEGLPKTKYTKIPFRMEMSAFSRLEGSIPVVGDIGLIWPVIAVQVCRELGIELDFLSHPQNTPEGIAMREDIVTGIKPVSREKLKQNLGKLI